jgi:carbonic anhydrase
MRRSFRFVFAFAVVLSLALPLAAQFPPPFEKPYTADTLWKDLLKGNALYHGGALPYTQLDEARKATVGKQQPPVTVLSCSDSRVPAELVFGRGVGDLFVIRAAGNVADVFGIASIEYGIAHHWTKVIVVLGHQSCGAVEAALEKKDPSTPSLRALVRRIRRSFAWIDHHDQDSFRAAAIANAKASADYLVANSRVIRDAVRKKEVRIIVAYYELESGEVTKIR